MPRAAAPRKQNFFHCRASDVPKRVRNIIVGKGNGYAWGQSNKETNLFISWKIFSHYILSIILEDWTERFFRLLILELCDQYVILLRQAYISRKFDRYSYPVVQFFLSNL